MDIFPSGPGWSLRLGDPGDAPYLMRSFMEHAGMRYQRFNKLPQRLRYSQYGERQLSERLICDSLAVVAYSTAEPIVLWGWALVSQPLDTLHFVYVRADARRMGIGAALTVTARAMCARPRWYSHWTKLSAHLPLKGLEFDPYRAMLPPEFYLETHGSDRPNTSRPQEAGA